MTTYILTMLYIFVARICDQSIGTIRIVLIARGYRSIAPILGFFEVLIWLTAINKALQSLDSVYSYIIYAAGFATGNYVGMLLEEKIAIGYQTIRIITSKEVSALPISLIEEGFGITILDGKGRQGGVSVLYTIVAKRDVKRVLEIVNTLEPNAFITIEDVKSLHSGFISRKGFRDYFGLPGQFKRR